MPDDISLDYGTVAHFQPDGSVILENEKQVFTLSRQALEALRLARPGWQPHVGEATFYYSRSTGKHTAQVFPVRNGSSSWTVWSEGPGLRKIVAQGGEANVDAAMRIADREMYHLEAR